MFISKREAEERLTEDRNIFRLPTDSARAQDDRDQIDCEQDTPDEIEPPEVGGADAIVQSSSRGETGRTVDRRFRAGRADTGDALTSSPEDAEEDAASLSLSQLDDLLHPRIHGRAQYRGKLESQVAIAETELILGEAKTSRTFGLSVPQTHAYTRGLRSTADITNGLPPKPELTSRITKIKEQLAEKAAARLDLTLDALSASKIGEIKRATNLSKVAKDMAVILDKCTDTSGDGKGGVHFHIFVPDPVDAERYPTVTVGPKLEGIPSVSSVPSQNHQQ